MDVDLTTRRVPPLLFVLSVAEHPARAFARARGQRYWGAAFVLWLVVNLIWFWGYEIGLVALGVPLGTTVALMLAYPLTAIGRTVCDGRVEITDATASQAVLLGGLIALPVAVAHQIGDALIVLVLLLVTGGLAVGVVVTLWSTAFRASTARALGGLACALVIASPLVVPLVGHLTLVDPPHHADQPVVVHGAPA